MKESITARVGRIISGSLSMLIRSFENAAPEAVMEQAIHEIDSVIEEVRTELGKINVNHYQVNKRLAETRRSYEDLSQKAELAVKENREDLAEAAISRQLDLEAQFPVLESALKEFQEKEKELEGYVKALQAKKREMQEELSQHRKAQAETVTVEKDEETGKSAAAGKMQARVSKAESAFDRVLESQSGISASRADVETGAKLSELEDLARKNRIQERLAAVRAKVGEKP